MKCKKEIKGYGGTRASLVSGRPRKIPLRQRWQSWSRHKRWEERWNGKVGRALQVEGPEKASDAEDVWGCGTKKTKQWAHLGLSNTLLEKQSRALIRTNCDDEGQHPSASGETPDAEKYCSGVCLFLLTSWWCHTMIDWSLLSKSQAGQNIKWPPCDYLAKLAKLLYLFQTIL